MSLIGNKCSPTSGSSGTAARSKLLFGALSIIVSLTVSLFLLEIVLRFLPVHGGFHRLPVNQDNPILRYQPERTFVWSRGWNFAMVNNTRTNNYGFISAIDYDKDATSPLLAVIGDSYVEAIMVPFKETLVGRLVRHVGSTARVYSFAVSGAPLSQYLAYAEYVRNTFQPDGMVIVVVGNDFDESLMIYKSLPGYHYFVDTGNGKLTLERVDYSVSFAKSLARKSALVRYMVVNLELTSLPERLRRLTAAENECAMYVGNTPRDADARRVADSRRAVDSFLEELPGASGLNADQILFVIDGLRPHLYDAKNLELGQGSYFEIMRRYFLESVRDKGYKIIDMEPLFVDHYRKYGQRFEYIDHGHWNAIGHELVFEAIRDSSVFLGIRNGEG